jgi:RHH-type rel operon transcriptional repressor/antitoxin RelB
MSTISLRIDEKDAFLIKKYASLKKISVSELLRNSTIEKIEDEFDLALFDKAFEEMTTTYSLDEVKKELGFI